MVGPDPPVSHISLKYDSIKIKVNVRSLTKLAMQQLCKTSFYPVAVVFDDLTIQSKTLNQKF